MQTQIRSFETLDYWFSGICYFGYIDIYDEYDEWRTDDSLHFFNSKKRITFLKIDNIQTFEMY